MEFSKEHDAIYGLRNLSVMDEEETRIQDYADLPDDIRALVETGRYSDAYRLAIAHALMDSPDAEVRALIASWVETFNSDQGYDDDTRSEERRVGKEGRYRRITGHVKRN